MFNNRWGKGTKYTGLGHSQGLARDRQKDKLKKQSGIWYTQKVHRKNKGCKGRDCDTGQSYGEHREIWECTYKEWRGENRLATYPSCIPASHLMTSGIGSNTPTTLMDGWIRRNYLWNQSVCQFQPGHPWVDGIGGWMLRMIYSFKNGKAY